MKTHNRPYLFSLALAISLAAVPAFAQDAPADQAKASGSVTVGAQNGTGIDDSSKLQQYETVPKGVTVFDANFDWLSSKYFMKFDGTKLGQDDQSAAFQAGAKRAWKLNLSLNENPRWFSNTAETLYTQPSPGVFVLPDGMRTALQKIWSPATSETAAPANSSDNRFWSLRDYMNGAQPVDLRYVRKTGVVGFDVTAVENWTFKASYQRETRDGSQPVAFTAGPGIDEVANPVKYTTHDTRAEVEFDKNKLFLNASFDYSKFHNDVLYTVVDNPVRLNNTDFFWTGSPVVNTAANATARLWNAPDNKSTSVDFVAGYMFPAHHKVMLNFDSTVMTNDYTFVEQALNPNLNLATNNASYGKFTLTPQYPSYNGKYNQNTFVVTFTGDPNPKFGYSLLYRSYDLTDNSPSYTFLSTVNSDGGASYSTTGGTTTGDYGFGHKQVKFEVHVSPAPGFKVGFNVGTRKDSYDERDYLDVKDTTIGATVDAKITSIGNLRASYASVRREPGAANPTALGPGVTGGPLDVGSEYRDIAKQDSKTYNVTFTLTPIDRVSVALFGQGAKSDFPDTSIGLSATNVNAYGVDLTLVPVPQFSLDAGYIYEKLNQETNLWYAANGTAAAPAATNFVDQYWNSLNDKVTTASFGIRWDVAPKKVDVGTNFSFSKGTSNSDYRVNPGGQAGGDMFFPTNTTTVNFAQFQYLSMPQVFNKTTIWKTWINFHVDKNVTLSLLYWKQKFDQADYAYDMLAPYMQAGSTLYATTPGAVANIYPQLDPSANRAMFLGAGVPNYDANIVRASLTYRF